MFKDGKMPYIIIRSIKTAKTNKKSNPADKITLKGKITRGKYIFDIIPALPTTDMLASVRDREKNCHGTKAEYI
jgi:hypothetical protein